ncbi:MAG: hypothetical protein JRC99_13640 [Deltaproteobacteria bacterium]|nr:hypothetical protein [Deltaproteobacteria bacterium]
MSLMMKPQDILIALKILVRGWPRTYADLGEDTGMSADGAHTAVQRAVRAGLVSREAEWANKQAIAEFLVHGLKYAFPVEPGPITRGMPTSYAVAPLAGKISHSEDDVPVWPDPDGTVRGWTLTPLCRSAPEAAEKDPKLYEWLALVDAVRCGRAREREMAVRMIRKRLGYEPS